MSDRTHVFLKITMDWPFDEAELNNLFEDSTISLPNGQDIKPTNPIECILIIKED